VALVAAAIGVALVYSMGRVYLLRTVPVWNTVFTPVMFFVTTFLLGSMAMGPAFVATYHTYSDGPGKHGGAVRPGPAVLRWIAIRSTFLLGIEFVAIPMRSLYLAHGAAPEAQAAAMLVGPFGVLSVLRLALVFAGAGLLGVFIYRNASSGGGERVMGTLAYVAFVLVLIGEMLGRFLFYATYARVGV
jgi:anaerobic dimethyl sulfoxide reductase subunit C (anchor subunit)